ncbi:MAG: B12-binding domain-containing radical SAM protein [Eubacteriales bacterium]
MKNTVLLIGFYNEKAIGVKYIANSLKKQGYIPHVLLFKGYNSLIPDKISETEFNIFRQLINKIEPDYIGLSVMSSLYLESILKVNSFIRSNFKIPIIWGGVYSTLFPERCLEYADYVICGEGEEATAELLNTLNADGDISDIKNLVFKQKDGIIVKNPVRPLIQDLDSFGYPKVGDENIYFINKNKIIYTDPQLTGATYETAASRGCPFTCSYCSSVNLKRIYKGNGKFVRFRSVDSIIRELSEAKKAIKNLSLIRFWDEIFSDEEGWVEEFKERYQKEINIPFNIWGHPLKINKHIMNNLKDAGLHQIVVGIQSGSSHIRKDIFHRSETQEQIIESSRILSECRIPSVIYDFMLQHPFETLDDLKETFELCMKLEPPFELQLHGLNFLPGTDIVDIAIKNKIITNEQMEKLMYSSMQEQYDMYWGPADSNLSQKAVLTALIYMTQFQRLRPLLAIYERRILEGRNERIILPMQKTFKLLNQIKHVFNNFRLLRKRY